MSGMESQPRQFKTRLLKLREEKLFTDIDIVVGDDTYCVHRCVMCASSDYFLQMFTGSLAEASQNSVTLETISSPIFKIVVDFIYGALSEPDIIDKLNSEECSVEDLLHAADMLQLDTLKELITKYMITNVSEENMLAVYALGWKYNVHAVCDKTSKAISSKFQKLVGQEDFNNIDVHFLKALLSSPYLTSCENAYCKAVLKWFQYDIENREKYFDEVMSLFCFHRLDPQLALGTVTKLYEKRGKKRTYDMACGENLRCLKNSPKSVTSHDELCRLFGNRYVNLTERMDLMNTFSCKYSYGGRKVPADLSKIKMTEDGKIITFDDQLCRGDHHVSTFHQGAANADHAVVITGNYWYKSCGDHSLGLFSRLPKVRLITSSSEEETIKYLPNSRYSHERTNPALDARRMYRYPYIMVIGGAEVDMEDAVRFACSLVVRDGDCPVCKMDFNSRGKGSYHFLDIWSLSSEKKRAEHFVY